MSIKRHASSTSYSSRWRIAQWFELRWWIRYLAPRQPQAYLNWKRSYWHAVLSRLSMRSKGRILDAGCGPAGIFTVLPQSAEVYAIDPLIDAYEDKLPHFSRSYYPSVTFRQSTIEEWHDKSFYDVIFCMNALNHVNDIGTACRNLADHVVPGGWLVLTADVHRFSPVKTFLRKVPGDMLHPHQLSLADYISLLGSCSLTAKPVTKIRNGNIFDHYLIEAYKPFTAKNRPDEK